MSEELRGKRYIALARCSTDAQTDTSIGDQLRLIRGFAQEWGMIEADEVLLEGVSGSIERNLDEVVRRLIDRKQRNNDFEAIVIQDASRFSRSGVMHTNKLRHELDVAGIEVISATGYAPRDSFSDLRDSFEAMASEDHARKIGHGSARGSQSAIEDGRRAHCARAPYGIDRLYLSSDGRPLHRIRMLADGSSVRLASETEDVLDHYDARRGYRKQKFERIVLVPGAKEDVETIAQIYRRRIKDQWGYCRIAQELNGLRHPGPTGLGWSTSQIRYVLNNPCYTGLGVANRVSQALYFERQPASPGAITKKTLGVD